ncbi:MAG: cell division protein FtsL [Nitrospirota bacterium]|nr:cell division protein FtsL [Nitrospirota bacterium]
MNTRTGHIGAFPLEAMKNNSVRRIVLAGIAVIALMTYVGGKVQIMRLGYQINDLEKKKQELERSNRALQIEASSLSTPARIEEIAVKRLGMVRPPKENIVVVKRRSAATGTAPADRVQRPDDRVPNSR